MPEQVQIDAAFRDGPTLWFVGEVYYPEEISTGYYLTAIAEGLAAERNVKVITGQPKHMARGQRAKRREIHNGVTIYRAPGTTFSKNVMLFRLVNMVTIGISVFLWSLWLFRKGDHVVVVTAPPSLPVTTALAAMLRGSTMTVLVQDSYPEILVAVEKIRQNSIIAVIIDLFNRWVYKFSTRIIVMGRDMADLFERKCNGIDTNIVTIPNWADLESIEPLPREGNPMLEELGLIDKFVLLYAGNIGHPTDVETIVKTANILKDRADIHFLFIGDGAKKRTVVEMTVKLGLENVTILDYRPRSEQTIFLNACDVGLVALINGMWGTAMPSRTYNIMAAGPPVLALTDEESELARVIDEDQIGWHIDPGDPEMLAATIEKIYSSRSELAEMGDRARHAAIAKYSREDAVRAYADALT